MTDKEIQLKIAQAYQAACMDELMALKPGNVHIFADGHGMTVQDFMKSAEASASTISEPCSIGERIFNAVQATQQAVGCNTNLGIILLIAPLVQAAYGYFEQKNDTKYAHLTPLQHYQQCLQQVLSDLTLQDAQLCAKAIVLAKPAGLGQSEKHDVNDKVNVNLQTLMRTAESRDLIAYQYTHQFETIFLGFTHYQAAMQRWQNTAWATTALYLQLLANKLDSHIVRKHGESIATQAMLEAKVHAATFQAADNPKLIQKQLLVWDAALKAQNINPGTTADLTVATLFMRLIVD